MNKKLKIFVYGSLREGFFNYDLYLKGKINSIRPAEISGFELYHMPYKGYPAVLPGKNTIVGEVVELINYDSTLKPMDEMEGFLGEGNPNNEYSRKIVKVKLTDDESFEDCYSYFYNKDIDTKFQDEAIYIENGDWKEYMLKEVKELKV
ncbi:gamma-glutamylcyclotransferase family protein [Clostridium sp.]|nr:gamma-glutamylcyclotransferase family protein [Clostridium sp.]MDU3524841.1 gamma-glutamylcyclotransferase family protein [Clostridium sp.]